jgi:long-chain acyl-CoA synthetase
VKALLARIRDHAGRQPRTIAIGDDLGELDYQGLDLAVDGAATLLDAGRVGLLLANGRHWAVADLALAHRGALCIPLPGFFTDSQLGHIIRDADLDLIVTDDPRRVQDLLGGGSASPNLLAGREVWLFRRLRTGGAGAPAGTAKVTYTSGTTGQPKGVCLAGEAIAGTAIALCRAVGANPADRALSLLPLTTLLENIGGLYAPLNAGARAQVPALATCGLDGSSGLRPGALFAALDRYAPTTLILVPQLLKALVGGATAGLPGLKSLRFAAVGGAPVSPALIAQARSLGIPAYEGYGLSEAASVVCLNRPGADRPGSAGRSLPHASVSFSPEGEVLVQAPGFLGYLGTATHPAQVWPTGDLGHLDSDGFLHLSGRRKSAFATAFGRNVAPEWVEGELTSHPDIAHAAVFGEGRPFNTAVLVPRPSASPAACARAVQEINTRLPDYAQVAGWVLGTEPFTPGNGLAGPAGTPRREAVHRHYRKEIDHLYSGDTQHVAV